VFRSLTQLGGLLLLLRHEDSLGRGTRRQSADLAFAGLGADAAAGGRGVASGARLQLIGRVLLMGIFFLQGGRHLFSRGFALLPALGFCALLSLSALVVIGFKARWSALILATSLGLSNLWMYPFWMVSGRARDFTKYYFFNTLSLMGGLLLLVSYGPGGLSMDHGSKKGI